MSSLMPDDVMPVRFMVISYIKHWVIFIERLFHDHLRCGEWVSSGPSAHQHLMDIGLS